MMNLQLTVVSGYFSMESSEDSESEKPSPAGDRNKKRTNRAMTVVLGVNVLWVTGSDSMLPESV